MYFPTIALIGKHLESGIREPLLEMAIMLENSGRKVLFERETAHNTGIGQYPIHPFSDIGQLAQLAIVMGGDGTMLGAVRELAAYPIDLIGINHGRLGFITDIPLERALVAIQEILQGQFESEERSLLQGRVERNGQVLFSSIALNDVVLSRASAAGMIEFQVEVDGLPMGTQRADGLVIATPTGSTAYALSANGPILHPQLRGIVMVPVAPQTLSNRPITLPEHAQVVVTLLRPPGGRTEGASVHFDMQSWSSLQTGDQIIVESAQQTARFLHPLGYNYFATLRKKLMWNQMYPELET